MCVALFEPIDNSSLTGLSDHRARLRWLDELWSPPSRGAAAGAWSAWRARVEAGSVFGQRPLVRESLAQCSTTSSVAFGLKARLSRLLTHSTAVSELRELLVQRDVRVLRLGRRNRIKQALAEYRRLHAGLGHFRVTRQQSTGGSSGIGGGRGVVVDSSLFRRSLKEVERSHRLASRVLSSLAPGQPVLELSYEELLTAHTDTVSRVARFLRAEPHTPREKAAYVKATPDRLCAAVSNYGELCRTFQKGQYRGYFDEPCDTRCEEADPFSVTSQL